MSENVTETATTVELTKDFVLTGDAIDKMSPKAIQAMIELLKAGLRAAKQREKDSQSVESRAAEARERGAKEEIARARKIGFNPEGPLHSEAGMVADIGALVADAWDRELGTWRKGERLLFLSRTGWVAGQVGQREWRPVIVGEYLETVRMG